MSDKITIDAEYYEKYGVYGPTPPTTPPSPTTTLCITVADVRTITEHECTCDGSGPIKVRCPACRVYAWVISPMFMRKDSELMGFDGDDD